MSLLVCTEEDVRPLQMMAALRAESRLACFVVGKEEFEDFRQIWLRVPTPVAGQKQILLNLSESHPICGKIYTFGLGLNSSIILIGEKPFAVFQLYFVIGKFAISALIPLPRRYVVFRSA